MGLKHFTKLQKHKYITIFSLLMVALTIGFTFIALPEVKAATYNYGEALQKAVYFYECQITGPKPSWNRVEWRGDSCMGDAVLGGWLDAGDYTNFGLPMAYSASMLGWAVYEYPDAFNSSGQMVHLKNNLKFVLDYFVNCDRGNSLIYQVGDGKSSWYGPVECLGKIYPKRSIYSCNASCVTGQTAAALAIGYLVLRDVNYLTHAKSLFNLADSVRSDATYTAASGFYNSWSGFWDELMWAATWLYLATGDSAYLAKAESYIPNLNIEPNTNQYEYKWAHSWDDSHVGAFLLLARITGNAEYHHFMQMHLDYWTVGYNGERITYTPDGLACLDSWSPLRYATTQAFVAFAYADSLTDKTLKQRYQNFAIQQVNYVLGSNSRNSSYLIGFGSNAPKRPNHRTAHGSWCNNPQIPPDHRHILYGALVGSPDSSGGYFDYEVACDYNAGFVGALAKMYNLYGGTFLSGFPAPETRDDEFYMEVLGSSNSSSTDTRINAVNRSGWPARMVKNLSYNYYVDLSELFAAGYLTSDVKVDIIYQEIPVTVSPLIQWSGNVYYTKVTFTDGTDVWPGGEIEYSREVRLRFTAPVWDAANDYSATGMTGTFAKTQYITMYDGFTLIWGSKPPENGQTPTPAIYPTTTPEVTPTPAPTATPLPAVDNIKVQCYNQSTAAITNQIYLNIRLVNTGINVIPLSKVKIRYYYTIDGAKPQNFSCDWSSIGSGNVTGTFVTMLTPKTGADTFLEIGFTGGAGSLAKGGNTMIQARVSKNDWSNYNQTNDYSFNPSATTYADWDKVTGFVLKWGAEP
jgi:hypothetical protein